jgi:hypothetical protein
MRIRNFSDDGSLRRVGGGLYFVLCQQQQNKTRERSNYSTLSQRFESIWSAMKLLTPGSYANF